MNIRNDFLEQGYFYHIYNRGINGQRVFYTDNNYLFFIDKLKTYLLPVADIYSYCLMENHFHLIIRIKNDFKVNFHNNEQGLHSEKSIVSKQMAKLLSSYTQAFNKINHRHGSIFESPFKRKRIESIDYLRNSIIYVHRNPLDLNKKFEDYYFSSYRSCISKSKTNIKRDEVIELFNDVENFKFVHQKEVDYHF